MVRNQTIYNLQARERERELFCKFYFQSSAIFCLKIGHCKENKNEKIRFVVCSNWSKVFNYFRVSNFCITKQKNMCPLAAIEPRSFRDQKRPSKLFKIFNYTL